MRRMQSSWLGCAGVALVGPAVRRCHGQVTHSSKITAQSIALDAPVTARAAAPRWRAPRRSRPRRARTAMTVAPTTGAAAATAATAMAARCTATLRYRYPYYYGRVLRRRLRLHYDYPWASLASTTAPGTGPDGQAARPQCKWNEKCSCSPLVRAAVGVALGPPDRTLSPGRTRGPAGPGWHAARRTRAAASARPGWGQPRPY